MQTQPLDPSLPNVVVLGLGQMGLVCAGVLASPADSGATASLAAPGLFQRPVNTRIWGRNPSEAAQLAQTRQSPRLTQFRLPARVAVSLDLSDALADASMVVMAIPVQFMRTALEKAAPLLPNHAGIVSVSKGIEEGTLLRPSEIISDVLRRTGRDNPDRKPRPIGCLSGPTIAAELARCLPAAMVAASDDPLFAKQIQIAFTTSWLRVYSSSDLLGIELAGAVKNVIAIAAGILDGLRAGNNAKSALLARGMAEIARLGAAMGASTQTFSGIAGMGDLATSCFSPEGRNRSCGEAIGRGADVEQYLAQSPYVVEGVYTSRAVLALADKYRVEVPITRAVHAVLFEKVDPLAAIGSLMTRAARPERDDEPLRDLFSR
ncbi:MAG: NAD(P)-dependent glycerol-3-phosphate dehydrogenase [Planctomycetes bacterium]|nr:NAD(P)-dependent glycerol-3-phosphate dehydrogenase [Planctomycetota bacterium]